MDTLLKHYLIVPENPCFHVDDCDCSIEFSQLRIDHDPSCPVKEICKFKANGIEVTWEEFDCEIGKIIYEKGLEKIFRHYKDPIFNSGNSGHAQALEPGKYNIEFSVKSSNFNGRISSSVRGLLISSCIEQLID